MMQARGSNDGGKLSVYIYKYTEVIIGFLKYLFREVEIFFASAGGAEFSQGLNLAGASTCSVTADLHRVHE